MPSTGRAGAPPSHHAAMPMGTMPSEAASMPTVAARSGSPAVLSRTFQATCRTALIATRPMMRGSTPGRYLSTSRRCRPHAPTSSPPTASPGSSARSDDRPPAPEQGDRHGRGQGHGGHDADAADQGAHDLDGHDLAGHDEQRVLLPGREEDDERQGCARRRPARGCSRWPRCASGRRSWPDRPGPPDRCRDRRRGAPGRWPPGSRSRRRGRPGPRRSRPPGPGRPGPGRPRPARRGSRRTRTRAAA